MRFIAALIIATLAFWGAIAHIEHSEAVDSEYRRVTSLSECAKESVQDLVDMCVISYAQTVEDSGVCYSIADAQMQSICFRSFLKCDFPKMPHYIANKCAINLTKIAAYTMQYIALIAAMSLALKFKDIRLWLKCTITAYLIAMALFITQYSLFYSFATRIPGIQHTLSLELNLLGAHAYLSFEGTYMIITATASIIAGLAIDKIINTIRDID
jgi:hypothetical protein